MILPLVLALLGQVPDSAGAQRRVDGRVVLGTRTGQIPVANQWVVLHRVGTDRSGPLDSTRTSADGRFTIRYRASGDSSAVYFATTSRGGIVYPTSPFREAVVAGDAATITVFDTTSGPVALILGGRHLIVGAPQANGRRPVGEVYDLQNDSTVTLIARDSVTPVWAAHIPEAAAGFQVNMNGELAAGAVSRRGSVVGVFAPLSPGIRQLAFTYELPGKAFPLRLPAERPIGVMEILVEEPTAGVDGGPGSHLREVAPVAVEGRTFRRFLAQDIPAGAIIRVSVPRLGTATRERVYMSVGSALVASMGIALVFAARRRRPARAVVVAAREPQSRALVRAIANLDDEFERAPTPDDATRDAYRAKRASLKQELADALAVERRTS